VDGEARSEFGNLRDFLISEPCAAGFTQLLVTSGFASSAATRQVILDNPAVRLKLIVGMARGSGIPDADHRTYCDLVKLYPERLECLYFVGRPLVHAKFYIWQHGPKPDFGIITSANFSWSGLGGYYEAGVHTNAEPLLERFSELRKSSISVLSPNVQQYIKIINTSPRLALEVSAAHGSTRQDPAGVIDRISLSLLTATGEIHTKSGLNWGQRDGRNPNQAYIPVPAAVHQEHPGFFPPRGQRFVVKTDDGEMLTCVIAQDASKAIETPDDNSALGLYFRKRIGVPPGEFITLANIEQYGMTNVEFVKIDNDIFFMDFSLPNKGFASQK
jgi:hypothetical protein